MSKLEENYNFDELLLKNKLDKISMFIEELSEEEHSDEENYILDLYRVRIHNYTLGNNDFENAIRLAKDLLRSNVAKSDQFRKIEVMIEIVDGHLGGREYKKANKEIEKLLSEIQKVENEIQPRTRAKIYYLQGLLSLEKDETQKANDYFLNGKQILGNEDNSYERILLDIGLERVKISNNEIEGTFEHAAKLYDECDSIHFRIGCGLVKLYMGIIERMKGNYDRGLHYHRETEKIFDQLDNPYYECIAHEEMAHDYMEKGNWELALSHYDRFKQIGEDRYPWIKKAYKIYRKEIEEKGIDLNNWF